jgi:hypothetical protein
MEQYPAMSRFECERDLTLTTLNQYGNNHTQICKVLGMPRSTLDKKLKQYAASGIPVPPAQNGGVRPHHPDKPRPFDRRL